MHFLVLGYDGTDEAAASRRAAVRGLHLDSSVRNYAAGKWLDSGALLDGEGDMVGSFIVCDYSSQEALHKEWLDQEPYAINGVWQRIEIHPIALSPRALSNRDLANYS